MIDMLLKVPHRLGSFKPNRSLRCRHGFVLPLQALELPVSLTLMLLVQQVIDLADDVLKLPHQVGLQIAPTSPRSAAVTLVKNR